MKLPNLKYNFLKIIGLAMLCLCISFFKSSAQCNAGETEVAVFIDAVNSTYPEEISWEMIDNSNGITVFSRNCGFYGPNTTDLLCLDNSNDYTFNAYDDWGDGWNGGSYDISITSSGCILASGQPANGQAGDQSGGCGGLDLEETLKPGENTELQIKYW